MFYIPYSVDSLLKYTLSFKQILSLNNQVMYEYITPEPGQAWCPKLCNLDLHGSPLNNLIPIPS